MRYLWLILAFSAVSHPASTADAAAQKTITWSYDNDYTGQDEWGYLTPAYAACAAGTEQSPINIGHTETADIRPPQFHYQKAPATLKNLGYTVEIAPRGTQTYTERGKTYTLRAIRFHSPSEHMVRDMYYTVEIHLIHEDKDKHQLILAVFAEAGAAMPLLDAALTQMPKTQNATAEGEFDPSALIPASMARFEYRGSLTVPPCTEGVEWRIFKTPVTLFETQLQRLTWFTQRNARLPQPVYMRTVREIN